MRALVVGGALLLAIAAVVIVTFALTRARSDDEVESQPNRTPTSQSSTGQPTDGPSSRRSQSEIKAQLLDLGQKAGAAVFRVRLRAFGVQEVTWYQDGGDRFRLDLKDPGTDGKGRERIFVEDGESYFSCREPGICARSTTDLFDFGSDQKELEALGSVLVYGFVSFGEGTVDYDVTYHAEQIAGVFGQCFAFRPTSEYENEVCFDDQGVPLRLAVNYEDESVLGLRYEAVEVDHSVDDSDFGPPYPFDE